MGLTKMSREKKSTCGRGNWSETDCSMSPHCIQRRSEILDQGKRIWSSHADSGDTDDIFYTEFVIPLRELKADGLFENLDEIKSNRRGNPTITQLRIRGSINVDYPELVMDEE